MPALQFSVKVADVALTFVFSEDERGWLDNVFVEGSGQSMKLANEVIVILRQHGRDNVPFGGELKDRKKVLGGVEIVARYIDV